MAKRAAKCQVGRARFTIKGEARRLPECDLTPHFRVELEDGQSMDVCNSHLNRLRKMGLKNLVKVIDNNRPGHRPQRASRCGSYMRHRWNVQTGSCMREGCVAKRNPAMRWFGLGGKPRKLEAASA
jgi:hypothetical protein